MNVFLMYRDQPYTAQPLPAQANVLIWDLELEIILNHMAGSDEFIKRTAQEILLSGLTRTDEIVYRQDVLKDCLVLPEEVKAMFEVACTAVENDPYKHLGIYRETPGNILSGSVKALGLFIPMLEDLKNISGRILKKTSSEGLRRFCEMLRDELSESYLTTMRRYLKKLELKNGVFLSAELGETAIKPNAYILHDNPPAKKRGFLFSRKNAAPGFMLADRDDVGSRILSEMRDAGLTDIADATAQACDHIRDFFLTLKTELAFYIGCINLAHELKRIRMPIAYPMSHPPGTMQFSCDNLYSISLALIKQTRITGNTIDGNDKKLIVVTGANQGGKTTFLRSVGQAQIMMQCGMFVAGDVYSSSISSVFTHFKREEDASMKSGKLDEELERMSEIVKSINPDDLLLMNESFAATNEREGSEIASQVVSSLLESSIRIIFVTHFYQFANAFYEQERSDYLFLRAGRQNNPDEKFRLLPGKPQITSYGMDIYNKVFIQS